MSRVVHRLNAALTELMAADPRVFVIGEDILDPYGGAFKVEKGLSTAHPDRVITTPISEAGIVGVGAGLALRGYKAVVEIMFGDFSTLIVDQLVNQISKMTWMYGEQLDVHLVVRTPMGGRRGYGPTHSQSLERLFFGVPGLTVVAVSDVLDPAQILKAAVDAGQPMFLVEDKVLYTRPVLDPEALNTQYGLTWARDDAPFPTVRLRHGPEADVTLVAYGAMVHPCLQAAKHLHDVEELDLELVVPHRLSPLDLGPIRSSVLESRRVVVCEEGTGPWGWGAEVLARLADVTLEGPPERVAAKLSPIPASRPLEDETLPQVDDVVAAVLRTIDRDFV